MSGNVSAPFGYINITGSQPLTDLALYANSVTGDMFWYLMMLLLFGVCFMSLKFKTDTDKALLASMFIVTVLSSFFGMMGIINPDYIVFFWMVTGLVALLVYYNNR